MTHDPDIEDALLLFNYTDSPNGTLEGTPDLPTDSGMLSRSQIWTLANSHGESNPSRISTFAANYWVDDEFGALINYLKEEDMYDNTFIVLMSDHGMGAKGLLYDQGSKIVHFVRYPPLFGDNGPYIIPNDYVVSNVDLAAVIFELTSVSPPSKYTLDGISWVTDIQSYINNPTTSPTQTCCQYRFMDIHNSHAIVSNDGFQYIYRANPNSRKVDEILKYRIALN